MEDIRHLAKVIDIKDNTLYLRVMRSDACSICAAKNFCGMQKESENIITIEDTQASEFNIGEEVDICLSLASSAKAVIYGYILPLILLLVAIILSKTLGYSDFNSGISGIIVLIPYYFVLFLMRNKMKSDFKFKIIRHKTNG